MGLSVKSRVVAEFGWFAWLLTWLVAYFSFFAVLRMLLLSRGRSRIYQACTLRLNAHIVLHSSLHLASQCSELWILFYLATMGVCLVGCLVPRLGGRMGWGAGWLPGCMKAEQLSLRLVTPIPWTMESIFFSNRHFKAIPNPMVAVTIIVGNCNPNLTMVETS